MHLKQFITVGRRVRSAAKLGLVFPGMRRFRLPACISLDGQKVQIHAPNESGIRSDFVNLWLDDDYGLTTLKLHPRTILDIGANIGLFSIFARKVFRDAVIHAYEPNPRIVPYAVSNLTPLGIRVFDEGIGLENGSATIVEKGDSVLSQAQRSATGTISITAFRSAIEKLGGTVDLLKLDCEGAEWEILRDGEAFRHVRIIRMEYHLVNGHTMNELLDLAATINFSIDRVVPNNGFGIMWLRSKRVR